MNLALEKARQRRQEMKSQGIKPEFLNPLEKARRNPASLRLAINAMCYDCQGRDADPNNRKRVMECQINDCPLHPVRPHQAKTQ